MWHVLGNLLALTARTPTTTDDTGCWAAYDESDTEPFNQPASPACTDVTSLGYGRLGREQCLASATDWGRAPQASAATEQTWGFPAEMAPPGPASTSGTSGQGPDGSNWGQLLPSVRGNARLALAGGGPRET